MKQVLILGGTNFIGRVLVEQLIENNSRYDITLFNRGKRNAGNFGELKQIHGDRETDDYQLVCNRNWDIVIDCSGYYPITFEKLLNGFKGKVGRYIFISTISVYNFQNIIGRDITEEEPRLDCSDEQKTSALPDAYGEKKAEMERLLMGHQELDKIILRPSLVYGKYDFTDRFYYWLWRARFAEKIVMPNGGADITSITFVDDLARLIVAAMEAVSHNTVYNAATHQVTLNELVETCARQQGTSPALQPVPAEKLLQQGVSPWQDIALWLNGDMKISIDKVQQDFNFSFTPFAQTVAATAAYYQGLNWLACKYGISADKEQALLRV